MLAAQRIQALLVGPGGYFYRRRLQIVTLATRHGIATAFGNRDFADAGGLLSYGTDIGDSFRHVGAYAGAILKGTKPANLPVVQSTTERPNFMDISWGRSENPTVCPTVLPALA
jgi:putative tryptophan/tyrosine transport system substrate-binding protein